MGTLILIRHGETDKNKNHTIHTLNDPESLNTLGIKQIALTAKRLSFYHSIILFTSKEKRAKESADILSHTLNVKINEVDGLQERNWGIFKNKPWNYVQSILDPMSLKERYEHVPKGGESWKMFETRLVQIINQIISAHEDSTVIVVTHGGVIRALIPYSLGVSREESFKLDPDNASLTIFKFEKGRFIKELINDTDHLKKCAF